MKHTSISMRGRIAQMRGSTSPHGYTKAKGQAAVLLALSMLALIAFVGLAVDGGSMYAQRRNAQNSADGAAYGATRAMLNSYLSMVVAHPEGDVDGSVADEAVLSQTLTTLAQAHGIPRSNLHAYYINDNKQLVTTTEVGSYGGIPFTLDAKGIVVHDSSSTGAYFMKVFGWDTVSAGADATAFMGVATDIGYSPDGPGIVPVGMFTNTTHLNQLVPGRTYTILDEDPEVAGNWGYVGFNGNNTPHVNDAWQQCGYNPGIHDQAQWAQWCASDPDQQGTTGPTLYNTGWPSIDGNGQQSAYALKWGAGMDGWWIPGDQGKSNQQCHNLDTLAVGQRFLIPVFDSSVGTGNNSKFHMIGLAWFTITMSDIDCNGSHLEIQGVFQQQYTNSVSGTHGDVRHTSLATVFMGN